MRISVSARRALTRWSWRLLRREWRQQSLILALLALAIATTVVGSAVAADTPPPESATFGSAQAMIVLGGGDPALAGTVATLERVAGAVEVIESKLTTVPGTTTPYAVRAEDPRGPFSGPMLTLVSGRWPRGSHETAMTAGLLNAVGASVGSWEQIAGVRRRVVGVVQNPGSLLDEFALVPPGELASTSQVELLFDRARSLPASLRHEITWRGQSSSSSPLASSTMELALVTLGMLLIAMLATGGFSVLAQRRLRSLGQLGALGATPRHVRYLVRSDGALVGVLGAVLGTALGLGLWLAYRPLLEQSSHHRIGAWQLPWPVVGGAVALGVVAMVAAASRPARAIAQLSVLSALSSRPAPAPRARRSVVAGGLCVLVALVLLHLAPGNASSQGRGAASALELVGGLVALVVAVTLLAPPALSLVTRAGRRMPIGARLALTDLRRYRARSGPAVGAIALGVLIASRVALAVAARGSNNALDYAGVNLAPNQVALYTPDGPYGPHGPATGPIGSTSSAERERLASAVAHISALLGARSAVELDQAGVTVVSTAPGRTWSGPIYVGTPALLRAVGIDSSTVPARADLLTSRSGLSSVGHLLLVYGSYFAQRPPARHSPTASSTHPCPSANCRAHPVIVERSQLPSGTSAPNTVLTEAALARLHLPTNLAGWWLDLGATPSASAVASARMVAASAGLSMETKTSEPTTATVVQWATVVGMALALAILAMTLALLRSETRGDRWLLAATGQSGRTRRVSAAVTAGALTEVGVVVGLAGAYAGIGAWFSGSVLDGGLGALSAPPTSSLLFLLVATPLLASAGAGIVAGPGRGTLGRVRLE